MTSFRNDLQSYRDSGAASLKADLPRLVRAAIDDSQVTGGFRYFVADVCMDLKEFHSAIQVLQTQDRLVGLSDVGFNNLGYCYWELEDHESAYRAFANSLAINSDNVSSARGATFCATVTGRNAEARDWGKQFYERSGKSEQAALWYATALFNADERKSLDALLMDRASEFGDEPFLREFKS